jgi:hypothetical protein
MITRNCPTREIDGGADFYRSLAERIWNLELLVQEVVS